ncbi:MAG: ISNCY family transposase [Burkholderiales bacterium]
MRRTEWLQETRKMRFEQAFEDWNEGRLSQEEAACLLGVCARSFRRYVQRFEAAGLDGLIDQRLGQVSQRRAPVDEVMALTERYRRRHTGWNVKHFYAWYRTDGGSRSYTWVKLRLQDADLAPRGQQRGAHRQRRERAAMRGMLVHQDASTHEWVAGCRWDLVVTMDDATSEHYSMFFVEQEGTVSSLRGVRDVIGAAGLFAALYTDRGSHYWFTPAAGGKVDRTQPTLFGQAMQRLGIEMIAAYSPEARGRSERAFRTHQERLPKELTLAGIGDMDAANRYLAKTYRPAFNREFAQPPREPGSAFVPYIGPPLDELLCEVHERVVGNDNCVQFERLTLQIPADTHRCHYVKVRVKVRRHIDGMLSIAHGPRVLARFDAQGKVLKQKMKRAA